MPIGPGENAAFDHLGELRMRLVRIVVSPVYCHVRVLYGNAYHHSIHVPARS